MEYILCTNGLTKQYRKFKALNNLNMHVPKGRSTVSWEKTEQGRTTLIRLICGLQEPTNGEYSLYGRKKY